MGKGKQVAFMAEDFLLKEIEELAKKLQRSKSDILNALIWADIQRLKSNPPETFGELMKISAGTAGTFNLEIAMRMLIENPSLQKWFLTRLQEETQKRIDATKGMREVGEGGE